MTFRPLPTWHERLGIERVTVGICNTTAHGCSSWTTIRRTAPDGC
jgi:hypothetical protein